MKSSSAEMAFAIGLICAMATTVSPAQSFTTLVDLNSDPYTNMSLVQGFDGDLYGTQVGAINGYGDVFKVTLDGTLSYVFTFDNINGGPRGGVVQATDGNLYGTTFLGGSNKHGTVFGITPSGTLTMLHSLGRRSGIYPQAALVQATNGKLYGTTDARGAHGGGTVFKITTSGTLNVLYNFCAQGGTSCTDGFFPNGLIQATNGSLYGTTQYGGNPTCNGNGCGTVFKISLGGMLTTLHTFCTSVPCSDGGNPTAALVQAADGKFYGTTYAGGCCGAVFSMTAGGTVTNLHYFEGTDGQEGAVPTAPMIQATDGNFYGTTIYGGANITCGHGCGTVFKIGPNGDLTTLHSFCAQSNCTDGYYPDGLVQATDGNIYGTTTAGGINNGGTVFKISLGLSPFVETLPTSGTVRATVYILGTNLTGASSVSFNGTTAPFNVVSSTEITTAVPAGATTGFVTVVTPGGTLKSNKKFRVTS
jgi:uncharacterized repeat protein (TIGR03803 family)